VAKRTAAARSVEGSVISRFGRIGRERVRGGA